MRRRVSQGSVPTASGHGVINSGNALRFFKDNTRLTEESAGSVASIWLYSAAMTPGQDPSATNYPLRFYRLVTP
jgi:hypothetical protein